MMAWFSMRPVIAESTVTWKTTAVVAPMAIDPPVVPLAPVPSRTRTVRDPARYSP